MTESNNVTSRALRTPIQLDEIAIKIAALCIIIPVWLADGKYSLDGIVSLSGVFRSWVGIPAVVIDPAWGQWAYLIGIVLTAMIFTRIEISQWGLVKQQRWRVVGAGVLLVWAIANAIDLGTTWLGVTDTHDDMLAIQYWIATNPPASIAWSILVTYLPEFLFVAIFRRR